MFVGVKDALFADEAVVNAGHAIAQYRATVLLHDNGVLPVHSHLEA